ncbi:MFS transporter [Streptosporangium canum]|uniref:MFS transporter n=1 Tax=Streptosporangium canum TaxID=324952 RepID=UPI003442477B
MSDTTPRQAANARRAVSFFFILLGTVAGAWAARIPAVKHDLGLSDGQLSYGLLAIAAGLVVGMRFAGRLTDHFGSARVLTPAGIATALAVIPPGYAPTLPLLITTLFLYGLINASLDVSMNAHGVEVERAYGRPIMSSFHGVFSIGGLIGAGIGGLFAWLGLSPATTLAATGIPLALISLYARRHLLPTRPAAPATTPARTRTRWSSWIVLTGNHDPARAGQAIAQVATVGYAGLVAGPAIIGGAAEIIGLPGALAIPALLAAFMAASAGALRLRTPLAS